MKNLKCPECSSKHIIKRGKRKGNFGIVQIYRCKECGRTFADKMFRHKTYPARVVYNAINYYNLGNTLDETSKLLNKKFKITTGKTTIYSWIKTYQNLCPISASRNNFSGYDEVLFTKKFEHENLDYEFMYHKYKLDFLVRKQFPGLAKYINRFLNGFPYVFF